MHIFSRSEDRGFTPHLWRNTKGAGFTLIELLVVIAILAILAVAVVLVLNPAELLKQGRDSTRLSDLAALNSALAVLQTELASSQMGSSSVIYVSLLDPTSTSTQGTNCASLSLPSLPPSYTYHCAASSTISNVNGNGWVPVNFTRFSAGSPLGRLPLDPVNTSSTGQYYTYVTGGSWEITALPESQKYKAQYQTNPSIQNMPGIIAQGSDLTLNPLTNTQGLVGYWKFDEGSGTQATDSSGSGNTGTWQGTGSRYTSAKVGQYSGVFNGTNDYVNVGNSSIFNMGSSQNFTLIQWTQVSNAVIGALCNKGVWGIPSYGFLFNPGLGNKYRFEFKSSSGVISVDSDSVTTGSWNHIAVTVDRGGNLISYTNGIQSNTNSLVSVIGQSVDNSSSFNCGQGAPGYFNGKIDDVRIYNRALSAAEVQAIYNATR